MKRIRLNVQFPLFWDGSIRFMPGHAWLKVEGNQTVAYEDKEFSRLLPKTSEKISLDIDVPIGLETIEVVPPGGVTPVEDIARGWFMHATDPRWRIHGLRKVVIVFDDMTYDVHVNNEVPNFKALREYLNNDPIGQRLCWKPWAMAVYFMEDRIIAAFHWHSKLSSR